MVEKTVHLFERQSSLFHLVNIILIVCFFFSENETSVARIIIATHCESIVISVKNVAALLVLLLSVT